MTRRSFFAMVAGLVAGRAMPQRFVVLHPAERIGIVRVRHSAGRYLSSLAGSWSTESDSRGRA